MKNIGFLIISLLILMLFIFMASSCGDDDDDDGGVESQTDDDDSTDDDDDDSATPENAIPTTLDLTLIPVEESGKWVLREGPGEPHAVRDDLQVSPTLFNYDIKPLSMTYFMTTSDNHQTDEESPTRLTFFDSDTILFGAFESSFRPQEDLSPHSLNAIVRTANRIQIDYERDFDLLIALGDITDNAQTNELLVEIDVLSGSHLSSGIPGYARPDSGDLDIDPDSGLNKGERNFGAQENEEYGENINFFNRSGYPNSNADLPVFGLKKSNGAEVPWFAAIGNHDVLNSGNFKVFTGINFFTAEDYTSDKSLYGYIPGMANAIRFWEVNPETPFYISNGIFGLPLNWAEMFSVLDAIGMIPDNYYYDIDERFDLMKLVNNTLEYPTDDGIFITPDLNREFMAHNGIIQLLHEQHHGFKDNNEDGSVDAADGGWYSLDFKEILPESPIPLRFLFLDTTDVPTFALGGIGVDQLAWLEVELNKAINDKVLVIICSHHREGSAQGIVAGLKKLRELLHGCPNVIMHLEGHGHENVIEAQTSQDLDPVKGYWEVQIPSTCTFPQQARIIEIVDNRDGTGSIYLTNFDHWMTEGDDSDLLASLARDLAFYDELKKGDYDGGPSLGGMGKVTDRNQVLLFQIPLDVAEKLSHLENDLPITSVESLGKRYAGSTGKALTSSDSSGTQTPSIKADMQTVLKELKSALEQETMKRKNAQGKQQLLKALGYLQ